MQGFLQHGVTDFFCWAELERCEQPFLRIQLPLLFQAPVEPSRLSPTDKRSSRHPWVSEKYLTSLYLAYLDAYNLIDIKANTCSLCIGQSPLLLPRWPLQAYLGKMDGTRAPPSTQIYQMNPLIQSYLRLSHHLVYPCHLDFTRAPSRSRSILQPLLSQTSLRKMDYVRGPSSF